jgi:toxin ParE1/3/4
MQVRWSPEAAEDIERIVRHIQQDKPTAAREVATNLYDGITALETFPNRGRIGWKKGTRELVLTSLPYVAVYRVTKHSIDVLYIYHDAQNWRK